MKHSGTGTPTLSWALISRNSEKTLETTLKSLRAMTPDAEIVVVDTMSSDGSPEIAKRYADVFQEYAGPKGTWTREMYAFDDAAAARNKSFELATGKWVGWIDADDEFVNPEETNRLLAANGQLPPAKGMELPPALKLSVENVKMDPELKHPTTGPARRVASLEQFLELLPAEGPEVFYAPYLYRFMPGEEGAKGKAAEWQQRERLIRRRADGSLNWKWHRRAHEYLAPVKPVTRAGKMPTLLFVHRKEWSAEDFAYSTKRHYDIVMSEYVAGKREPFDMMYLCRYAAAMAPEREREFIDAFVNATVMGSDRAQALSIKAGYLSREGYFHEAVETYAAAIVADSTYPEAHFGLAQTYEAADQWEKAADAYARGADTSPEHLYAAMSPREHKIVNRIKGAICHWKASKLTRESYYGLSQAAGLVAQACNELGAMSTDAEELNAYQNLFNNELKGFETLRKLDEVSKYLIANDETQKAAEMTTLIPHNMLDHPIAQEMELHSAKIFKHGTDSKSYAKFYKDLGTDRFTSDEELKDAAGMERVKFLVAQLKKLRQEKGRPLHVLEVGPWDGISLIHCMAALEDSTFVGIEVKQTAIDELTKRVAKAGWSDRLRMVQGTLGPETMDKALHQGFALKDVLAGTNDGQVKFESFDAITFYEVIEHIPNTQEALATLRSGLDLYGRLFVSTPWGAFDRGNPANFENRDARGHVYAFMPGELVGALEQAGFRTMELGGFHGEGHFGDTIHLMAEPAPISSKIPSPQFAVAGSLWDWNASTVINTGMGASEETIVYLAREFGRQGGSPQVFGPIPKVGILDEVEVRDGVQYWPRQQLRHLDPKRPLVVSRAPGYGAQVKQMLAQFGKDVPKMYLWLQDCFYEDLNAQTALDYEKIVVLSHKHREQIARLGVPLEKMKIIPNFLLKEHFTGPAPVREPHRFIYCSSPDRGLIPLLKMWPMFLKEWPDATLGVYYGWEGAKKLGSATPGWVATYRPLREEYEKLHRQPGVEIHGRVNHAQIAYEMRRASVWPYPCFNTEVETFCSNAIKARAAGCVPVTTDTLPAEVLDPVAPYVVKLDPKVQLSDFEWDFFKAVKSAVGAIDKERENMSKTAIENHDLSKVLPLWLELLK